MKCKIADSRNHDLTTYPICVSAIDYFYSCAVEALPAGDHLKKKKNSIIYSSIRQLPIVKIKSLVAMQSASIISVSGNIEVTVKQ